MRFCEVSHLGYASRFSDTYLHLVPVQCSLLWGSVRYPISGMPAGWNGPLRSRSPPRPSRHLPAGTLVQICRNDRIQNIVSQQETTLQSFNQKFLASNFPSQWYGDSLTQKKFGREHFWVFVGFFLNEAFNRNINNGWTRWLGNCFIFLGLNFSKLWEKIFSV